MFNACAKELKRKINHESTGPLPHAAASSEDFDKLLRSSPLLKNVTPAISELLTLLSLFNAAKQLPSRSKPGSRLNMDIVDFLSDLNSKKRRLEIGTTAILLAKLIHETTDDDEIWSAVYCLVTRPTTPTNSRPTSTVTDTPFVFNAGSVHNTSEIRTYMDPVIKGEIADHIHQHLDFLEKFFYSDKDLKSLAETVFEKCKETGSYTEAGRWSSFPATCEEKDVVSWFCNEVQALAQLALDSTEKQEHIARLKSRGVSRSSQLVSASTARRKVDIAFVTFNGQGGANTTHSGSQESLEYKWEEILVPGELKGNKSYDSKFDTWSDLARYVREVYAAQDTRRFSHGFTLCGDAMRVWKFDRGAIYSSPPFSVNEKGDIFVMVVLGYLLMAEEELGYDTTICKDGEKRFISVNKEHFFIKDLIYRQHSILGRGTTCWRATREGGSEEFVIKDSWQPDGKVDEGKLLEDITKNKVGNVAHCYHSETVRIGAMDDDLHSNVRKQMELSRDTKWNPGRTRLGTGSGTSSSFRLMITSNSTQRKRVTTTTLESSTRKKSRSNSEAANEKGSDLNKFHKRIILNRCGKQLYKARTRIGVLQGLMGAISGHQNLWENDILHHDVSIGNVLLSEDEEEGFLIDLDHAIQPERTGNSGARGRTGTKVFMSIRLLLQRENSDRRQHSFMDDLESFFWLLFWICVHYTGPGIGRPSRYEIWNYRPLIEVGESKVATISSKKLFLNCVDSSFTEYFAPLGPWMNELRDVVFPKGACWENEDPTLYEKMKEVLSQAMKDDAVKAQ